jgi:glycosyltransferase involved in cell wall biosynthesis
VVSARACERARAAGFRRRRGAPRAPDPRETLLTHAGCSLSLIIAVHERPRILELVLASLERQTLRDFEVVIADDGSGPEVAALVREWGARTGRETIHAWQENHGFRKSAIVNRAVARSSGEYLAFIDGDCILHHRFLERHFRRRRPRGVLTGRRLMLDAELTARLTPADVAGGRVERPSTWWNHVPAHDRRNGIYLPMAFGWRGRFSARYNILGCNFSLFRADFLEVNGYDERIVGRGMEDINLRSRLINAGMAISAISQEALQYHCHHSHGGFPHDDDTVRRWRETREIRAPRGVAESSLPTG